MSSTQSPHQKQHLQHHFQLQQHITQIPRYPFPPSPPSSANVTAPSSPRIGTDNSLYSSNIFDFSPSILAKSPTSRPVSSSSHYHRSQKGDSDVSDIDQSSSYRQQNPSQNHDSPRKRNGKRSHPVRALTSPNSSITSPVQLHYPNTNTRSQNHATRRRSASASSSSSSTTSSLARGAPVQNAPPTSSSGMNRKVAESLQLFKETTATTTPSEEITGFTFDRRDSVSRKRKQGAVQHQFHQHQHPHPLSHHHTLSHHQRPEGERSNADAVVGEAEFEFVKRSAWPDRENAALRKEKSTNALGRVRTRESASSGNNGAVTKEREGAKDRDRDREREREKEQDREKEKDWFIDLQRMQEERRPSAKDLVISDLLAWRNGIEGGLEDEGVGGSALVSPSSAGTSGNESGRGRQRERTTQKQNKRLVNNQHQRHELPPPSLPLTPLHFGQPVLSDSVTSLSSVRTVQDLQRLSDEQERQRQQQQQRYHHRDVFSKSPISHSSSSRSHTHSHPYPPSPSPSRSRTTLRSSAPLSSPLPDAFDNRDYGDWPDVNLDITGPDVSSSTPSQSQTKTVPLSRSEQHDIHTSPYERRQALLSGYIDDSHSRSRNNTTSTTVTSTLSSDLNRIWSVDNDSNINNNDYYYYDDDEEEDSSNYDFFDSESGWDDDAVSMISNEEEGEGEESTTPNPSPPLPPSPDYLPAELQNVGFRIRRSESRNGRVSATGKRNDNEDVNVNEHEFVSPFDGIRVKEPEDALQVSPYTISKEEEDVIVEGDVEEEIDSMDHIDGGLPHIPLRPFRNQVGGHSAIYKFTKRAVCKPLVSRENLFYEAVEHEAPPLLSFIPRYLGVMLVSYRRVRRSSNSHGHSLLAGSFSRDEGENNKIPRTAPAAVQSRQDSESFAPRAASHCLQSITKSLPQDIPQVGKRPLSSAGGEDDTEPDTEMLEVALDHNRHIVPEWLLRQSCGIARHPLRHSVSTGGPDGLTDHHHHYRAHRATPHNRGTASTPDLALPGGHTQVNGKAIVNGHSPLASSVSHYDIDDDGDRDAPTPVNSPNISHIDAHLHRNGTLSPPSMPSVSEEGSVDGRPKLYSAASHPGVTSSVIFGGTGSTIVNTKLKDHVFGTIMKRFRRRTHTHFGRSVRTDDEANFADGEVEEVAMGYGRGGAGRSRRVQRVKRGPVDRLKDEELGGQIRRVQSESMMSAARERQNDVIRNGMVDSDVFSAGFNESTPTNSRSYMPLPHTRSPSRSNLGALHANGANGNYIGRHKESESPSSRQEHFILMEDLTGRLKTPCVLDIKMGTRQYGLDATSVKKKSQRKKCDRTTSRSLGVRVCGMQVWDRINCSYKTQDKYKGRELHAEDFPSVLASFLYDGRQLMVYHIPGMLQKLYALARIINRLKGYRFYGCSLLFIYDGDGEVQDAYKTCMSDRISSRSKRGESLDRNVSTHHGKNDSRSLRRTHSEDVLFFGADKRCIPHRRKRGEINIRIVDFAHTTTGRDYLPYPDDFDRLKTTEITSGKGYQADLDPESGLIYARFPPHYPDLPDRGFLFGLKNLAETLVTIWNEERVRRMKLSKDDSSTTTDQLPPICTEGKEIFDMIFNLTEGEADGFDYLST